MVYPHLPDPSYELERTISHSNLIYTSIEMKKKFLESLQTNFQIVIVKNVNITGIFNQRNLFNSLIHSFFSSIFGFS